MKLRALAVASMAACAAPTRPVDIPAEPERSHAPVGELERLVADLCDKDIVLLGEAEHGDGSTWTVKGQLVQTLVQSCGFSTIFIESGIYDFLALERAYTQGSATERDLANAVGALWADARETQPWIVSMHEAAQRGALMVMGLDDQLHSTAFYVQQELPSVLATFVPEPNRADCAAIIARHTSWTYDDAHPYSETSNATLLVCLRQVEDALAFAGQSESEAGAMASNLRRSVAREFVRDTNAIIEARDASMFENFQWHRRRLGRPGKAIVWCATLHAAKTFAGIDALRGPIPLGQHIHQAHRERVAAIGFTALAGATRSHGREPRTISEAPANSLEGRALADKQTLRYLDAEALHELGPIEGRPINHVFHRARWDEVLDGIVVFRQEEPAHYKGATP